jgi:nucleotide-binding universal stress UspA family protein
MATESATYSAGSTQSVHVPDAFRLIVCGVDGSAEALEGVRQAGALAGPDTTIEIVAVYDEWAADDATGPTFGKHAAGRAVSRAKAELADSPARVLTRSVPSVFASGRLLEWAAGADLLVVGRHGHSRMGGVLVGSTATNLIHRAHLPVLIAARPAEGLSFPGRILVAAGGPSHPEEGVRLAARIARRSEAGVTLLRVEWAHSAKRPELAEAVTYLRELTGVEPDEIVVGGTPRRLIPEYAEREQASLVITGSRGLTGLRSVSSVSERVAHTCRCSVLVMHGGE